MLPLFLPITKIDAAKRLVYGTIAEEVPDKAGEILDYASARPAFERWSKAIAAASDGKSLGNLRAMHGKVAAGKLETINFDDAARRIEGVAKVIDDDEWRKVEEGVYTGFSIGGRYARRWPDPDDAALTRYTPELSEISLVDNPCIPTATFAMIKADGTTETRRFKPAAPDVRQGWQAADGSFHPSKAAALRRNAEGETAGPSPAAPPPAAGEGEIVYADPGYQADRRPRYPIDTPAHIRAAWLFINRRHNQRRYTAAQWEAIKARIAAAWRARIDAAGPPSATPAAAAPRGVGKRRDPIGLGKGLDAAARVATLIEELEGLRRSLAAEAEVEGDASPIPDQLEAIILELACCLRDLVAEETAELLAADAADGFDADADADADDGADADDDADPAVRDPGAPVAPAPIAALQRLAKVGARNSRADLARLQQAHDLLVALGASCPGEDDDAADDDAGDDDAGDDDADDGGDDLGGEGEEGGDDAGNDGHDLTRAAAARDDLAKLVAAAMAPQLVRLERRLAAVEARPAAPKGAVRAVDKAEDGGLAAPRDAVAAFERHLEHLAPDERALALTKVSLANPRQMVR